MSLYYVQKFLYELNRDASLQESYFSRSQMRVLEPYELTDEEASALVAPDIGLLFHLGVNGQILMHFAALHQHRVGGLPSAHARRDRNHGPVREGVYAVTGFAGIPPLTGDT